MNDLDRLGDDPQIADAIDGMASVINQTELLMDARAFIESGTHPDELPTTRSYKYRYPEDGRRYRDDLRTVLRRYYENNGWPDDDS